MSNFTQLDASISHLANTQGSISIIYDYRSAAWLLSLSVRELREVLKNMINASRGLGFYMGRLELCLVDDGKISRLNRENLGVSGPTNILSFPSGDGGSLALSLDTLAREAALYGQKPLAYLVRLLAHGMGHLAGFDHGEEMDIFCGECESAAWRKVENV